MEDRVKKLKIFKHKISSFCENAGFETKIVNHKKMWIKSRDKETKLKFYIVHDKIIHQGYLKNHARHKQYEFELVLIFNKIEELRKKLHLV